MTDVTPKRLGMMCLAKMPCGKIAAAAWEDSWDKKRRRAWIRARTSEGLTVDRVERFEGDPQPEWICAPGCEKCYDKTTYQQRSNIDMSLPLDEITFKAGTILKHQGIPFELKEDTVLLGLHSNKELADSIAIMQARDLEDAATPPTCQKPPTPEG